MGFNLPIVLSAEGFCDSKTEAGAVFGFVGLVKTIEDFAEVFFRNGGAIVGDFNTVIV